MLLFLSLSPAPLSLSFSFTSQPTIANELLSDARVTSPQVPLVVLRSKDMRNSTNIFLVNLSVADLCVLIICTPIVLMEVNSSPEIWPFGELMCEYHTAREMIRDDDPARTA